jgi:quinol monooxygenase YgiN
MGQKIHVLVKLTTEAKHRNELLENLEILANASLQTPFCHDFYITSPKDQPEIFHLIETFDSAAGYAKHLETSHVQHFLAEIVPTLTTAREAIYLENQSSRVDNNPSS